LAELEVERTAQTLAFSGAEARTPSGAGVPLDAAPAGEGRIGFTVGVPVGVVGAILPFNFPLVLVAHKLGPAVAAGCPVVVKPSRQAPLGVLALADCLFDAGLPRPWLSVVTGPAEEVTDVLLADARVRFISFTGSSEVGWQLSARAKGSGSRSSSATPAR
jgi:acyl-CoA reductase-like NAD-dependent aldehyde dehydrogenase